MIGDDRAQNEVIGTMLTMALVILAVSLVGAVLFTQQGQQAEQLERPAEFQTESNETALTVTHSGGNAYPIADLELVIRQDGTERRYALADPAVRRAVDWDGDDRLEGGESVTVDHAFAGQARVLLVDTARGGHVLYDEIESFPGSADSSKPTIERFDVVDSSTDTDAVFDVTWNASDAQGDLTDVTVELVDGGTVVDSASRSFGGVASTGTHTDTLTNVSGSGEVYTIRITVRDDLGNSVTERVGDTADSDAGLRAPSIDLFEATDVSKGNQVEYGYTYTASDLDADLVAVTLELTREDTGTLVDNVTDTYSEVATTGVRTGSLVDPNHDHNDGVQYRITIVASDLNGNDASATTTDVADGSGTSGSVGSPPTIDQFDVTDTSACSGNSGGSYQVDWTVSDDDADLAAVTLEVVRTGTGNTNPDDSVTYSGTELGSDTDSGSGELIPNQCNKQYEIRITVEDVAGNTVTDSVTDSNTPATPGL